MPETYNIYCDESCHLQQDGHVSMVLGAVWCPKGYAEHFAIKLKALKLQHGIKPRAELKWDKVSRSKAAYFQDVIRLFFSEPALHFRAIIIPDKTILDHEAYLQDHDTWYYKMFFNLIKILIDPKNRYHVYMDIKDTRSQSKIQHLGEVLRSVSYDYDRSIIERIQSVRSHEVAVLQLADLLIGCVSYANRHLTSNDAKLELVKLARSLSGYSLTQNTLYRENKMNLLRWVPSASL